MADWLLDRLYQNQGRRSRGALAEFRYLKCLRLFDADALSISQMISAPITVTHLHLVEPFKGGTKTFLSDVAPSLHSLAFLCLESLTPTTTLGFSPKAHHVASPRNTQQHVDRDQARRERLLAAAGEVEVERMASGFQALAAHDPRLSVKLNIIRANLSLLSVNSESPSMVHRSTVSARHRRGIE